MTKITLQDPISKKFLIATSNPDGSTGLVIWVPSINPIFDKVSKDPHKFQGMVFKEIMADPSVIRFVRIKTCAFKWIPNPKAKGYPDLQFYAVQTEIIKDPLDATEQLEAHEKVLDKLNEEKNSSSES